MSGGWTPGPWVAKGSFYPHGTAGDVFAKDAHDVRDCTPICRVVRPVSHRAHKAEGPVIDALHGIAGRKATAPIIEANARLIAAAPDLFEIASRMLEWSRSGAAFNYPPGSLQELEQALAKARGA